MTAFDDKVSIFYFGEWLKGYYFRKGKTVIDAMNESGAKHDEILAQCAAFDRKLRSDCEKVGRIIIRLPAPRFVRVLVRTNLWRTQKETCCFCPRNAIPTAASVRRTSVIRPSRSI